MVDQPRFDPGAEQIHFAKEAVKYRELYYQGQDESIDASGPVEGPVIWAESKLGKQYSANNKWHMQQSDMFGSIAQTRLMQGILTELHGQTELLRDIKNLLVKHFDPLSREGLTSIVEEVLTKQGRQ